jgi:hypothetical protein
MTALSGRLQTPNDLNRSKQPAFYPTQKRILTALGTLLRILSVLALESDLDTLARDDKVGRLLQDQALPERRRRSAREHSGNEVACAVTDFAYDPGLF